MSFNTSSTVQASNAHSQLADGAGGHELFDRELELTCLRLLSDANGLASSARRITRRRAVLIWAALVLAVAAGLIVFDAVLRREEIGLRIIAVGVLLAVAALSAYRILFPAWRFAPTSLDVAKWIERSHPEYGEQLSTAVQLAGTLPSERRFGSLEFRRSAIRDWAERGLCPDWNSYLDASRWWRSVAVFLFTVGAILMGFVSWPEAGWLGLRRLAIPWSTAPWPRNDQLRFRNVPNAIAAGSELQIEVIDARPPIPTDIEILVREADVQRESAMVLATMLVGEMAIANLTGIESSIELRAIGGDDQSMNWHRIDVVRPPEVIESRFHVVPPKYSRLPSTEFTGGRIQVLAGSHVRFQGRLSERVRDLSLSLFVDDPGEPETADKLAAGKIDWQPRLADDHQTFQIGARSSGDPPPGWKATRPVSWQLQVRNEGDLEILLPQLWVMDVKSDAVPTVLLKKPLTKDLSADAELKLVGQANDDLGLTRIDLRVRVGDDLEAERENLSENPAPLTARGETGRGFRIDSAQPGAEPVPGKLGAGNESKIPIWQQSSETRAQSIPTQVEIDELWRLRELVDAGLGQSMTIWVEAEDTLGQIGTSQPQRFAIRSPDAILDSLRPRVEHLRERIHELVDAQRRNAQLANRTEELVAQAKAVDSESVDALSSVMQIQDSIRNQVSEGSASVLGEIENTLDLLRQNQLVASETATEFSDIHDELVRLASGPLDVATRAARQAHQRVRQAVEPDGASDRKDLERALRESSLAQEQALSGLRSILDRLAQSEALQQVQRDLIQILAEQEQLQSQSDEVHLQSIAGVRANELDKVKTLLSADQLELARQLDSVVSRMRALRAAGDAQATADSSPPGMVGHAEQIQTAADILIDEQASPLMRRGAQDITRGQISDAVQTQKQVVLALEHALESLGLDSRRSTSLEDMAGRLEDSSRMLSELAGQQAQLAQEIRRSPERESLADFVDRQQQLRQQTGAQAEAASLRATGVNAMADSLTEAMRSQDLAIDGLQSENRTGSADRAERAGELLRQAAGAAARKSDELSMAAQQQEMFRLSQALRQLVDDQAPIVAGLQAAAVDLRGTPSRDPGQLAQIRELAAAQDAVRQRLRDVREKTSRLPAFDWALEETEDDMSRCVAAAQRYRVQPEALSAAQAAWKKLQIASQALEPPEKSGPGEQANASQEDDKTNQRLVPPIASLRLLRGLQADLNSQTKAIDNAPHTLPDRSQFIKALAEAQQALGVKLQELLNEIAAASDSAAP